TRCYRDWSSDVCSSDLPASDGIVEVKEARVRDEVDVVVEAHAGVVGGLRGRVLDEAPPQRALGRALPLQVVERHVRALLECLPQIGRASCRERVMGSAW